MYQPNYVNAGVHYGSSSRSAPSHRLLSTTGSWRHGSAAPRDEGHASQPELCSSARLTPQAPKPRPVFESNMDGPAFPSPREELVQDTQMVVLPQDSSSDDDIPSRRNVVRRQNRAYLQEMRNAHAEGRRARHVIQTDALGDIIDQKSLWHRAVRSLARTELDWKIKSYKQHPEAWSYITKNIQRELNRMFIFVSTPVKEGYLEKYLSITITKDRYEWRKQWKERGTKHRKCPQEAYDLWLPHWSSEAGGLESENMSKIRSMKKPKQSSSKAAAITVSEPPPAISAAAPARSFPNDIPRLGDTNQHFNDERPSQV